MDIKIQVRYISYVLERILSPQSNYFQIDTSNDYY